jgi:RNA polymerase sigma-70 factor (ECF subfamily)
MSLESKFLPDAPSIERVDPEAWVRRHADDLFRHALAMVRKHEVAEDLIQETFLAAWEGRDRFEGRSSERTWLLRILRNKIADYYRDKARNIQFEDMEVLAEFEAAQFRSGLGGNEVGEPQFP